jgi:hypothetical protein
MGCRTCAFWSCPEKCGTPWRPRTGLRRGLGAGRDPHAHPGSRSLARIAFWQAIRDFDGSRGSHFGLYVREKIRWHMANLVRRARRARRKAALLREWFERELAR